MLSIVLPCHNEQENVPIIYQKLIENIKKTQFADNYEIIFVNDGSSDNTFDEIAKLNTLDSNVKGLSFIRNFGHQNALFSGIISSNGEVLISMDADMQHPPEVILDLIEKYNQGYDIVITRRGGIQAGFIKRICSKVFYSFFRFISGVKIEDNSSDFRLITKPIIEVFKNSTEKDMFFRGYIPWIGGKQGVVDFKVNPRLHGTTSYSFSKSLKLAMSGITGFSILPIKIMLRIGMFVSIAAFAYGVFQLAKKLLGYSMVPGYTDLIVTELFLGGVILMGIGILGKYLSIVLNEIRQRPNYIVKSKVGL